MFRFIKKKFLIMKNNHAPHKKIHLIPFERFFLLTSWNDREWTIFIVYLQGNFLRSYLGPKFLYAFTISLRSLLRILPSEY